MTIPDTPSKKPYIVLIKSLIGTAMYMYSLQAVDDWHARDSAWKQFVIDHAPDMPADWSTDAWEVTFDTKAVSIGRIE